MKKRVIVFGSCVIRDALEFKKNDIEIVTYISGSAMGSAFAKKPFLGASDEQIEKIGGNFFKKCVMRDMRKQTREILRNNDYEAIIIDYVDERFALLFGEGAIATLSDATRFLGVKKWQNARKFKMHGFRRLLWWRHGVKALIAIAKEKQVPIFLACVYPAQRDEKGKYLYSKMPHCLKDAMWLWLLYRLTPRYIKKIAIARDRLIMADEHQWGGNYIYHYTAPLYRYLSRAIYNKLVNTAM
ncbi:DUF6270 domain-containing protein [Candidatus Tokpelaia sp.]|uniref:DUF6270 domain-containing protein n=1 Tax=Candidatus Tokpelaia sp. TaxID=2233777 RepID=UPI00123BD6C5|nr:DUF6270 domain-containing protein [Candidatus Tokpelaia sp.]KAA6405673.1 hypothetical protein DPQ22_03160 [Candidatus Tokpelaia sp.]